MFVFIIYTYISTKFISVFFLTPVNPFLLVTDFTILSLCDIICKLLRLLFNLLLSMWSIDF